MWCVSKSECVCELVEVKGKMDMVTKTHPPSEIMSFTNKTNGLCPSTSSWVYCECLTRRNRRKTCVWCEWEFSYPNVITTGLCSRTMWKETWRNLSDVGSGKGLSYSTRLDPKEEEEEEHCPKLNNSGVKKIIWIFHMIKNNKNKKTKV